jgi:protein TonB
MNQLVSISIDLLEELKQNKQEISLVPSLPQNLTPSEPYFSATSGGMRSKIIHDPPPRYPWAAKQQRIQGTVVIDATIDQNGKIREPYILSSRGQLLDEAALDAIRKWQYVPSTKDGKPMAVETTISIIFSLNY